MAPSADEVEDFYNSQFPSDAREMMQQQNRREVDRLGLKLDALHKDVSDMKDVLRELTSAINRLAIIEERQSQTSAALERAFVALKAVEERTSKLELAGVNNTRTSAMVDKVVWMVVAAAVGAVLVLIGLKK